MNANFLPALLQAAPAEGGNSLIMTGVTFGLVILIFYFLIIRPQNKKQKEAQNLLKALKKGDRVYTVGGLHGTIQSLNEEKNTVTLKVDEGSTTTLEFNRSSVAGLVNPPTVKKEEAAPKTEKKAKTKSAADPKSEETK